jgi:hypothetical protein
VDEVTRPCLGDKLKSVAPAHPSTSANDVDDTLDRAVMMSPSGCSGVDVYGPGPQLLSTVTCGGDCCRSVHARGLGRICIQLISAYDMNAFTAPTLRIS